MNAIAPGAFDTDMMDYVRDDPEKLRRFLDQIPQQRAGGEDDVKGAAVFLCQRRGGLRDGPRPRGRRRLAGAGLRPAPMPVYRVSSPGLAESRLREWRRGVLRTVGLLLAALVACAAGLVALDTTDTPTRFKLAHALWNAANLLTTLGDFTAFDERQKVFMMGTMLIFLVIGGYALSRLTGILSSDAVMSHRENRSMAKQLDRLAGHVIVIGFRPVGQLVARRLREAGDEVVVVDRDEAPAVQASEQGYLVVRGDAGW